MKTTAKANKTFRKERAEEPRKNKEREKKSVKRTNLPIKETLNCPK